ncbi:MAG: phosphoribosylformylglycinamidine cyclo-ligase, partial [Gammaproteobacteria bacterium HGW-Gammaproteobacteria-5]
TIYVKPILSVLRDFPLHAMAHITGGGLQENIIRVVPDGLGIRIDASAWALPPLFDWLQREGAVANSEMWRTFNCGIGFTLLVAADDESAISQALDQLGLSHWTIGEVVKCSESERVRIG